MSQTDTLKRSLPSHAEAAPSLGETIGRLKGLIDARLGDLCAGSRHPAQQLPSSMRYSVLSGGKRIRPIGTLLAASAFGAQEHLALDPACAVEMVHAASLIIDDLPCMDDASTRRGQAANHVKFGEDVASLAAISLLSKAFGVVASAPGLAPQLRGELVGVLSAAVGEDGLAAGQEQDLRNARQRCDHAWLEQTQHWKTGALFIAAVEMGGRIAGVGENELAALREFSRRFGLAFQALDDLLDARGLCADIGKDAGNDAGKPTMASIMSHEKAEALVVDHAEAAIAAVQPFGERRRSFEQLISFMLERHLLQIDSGETLRRLRGRLETL